MSQESETAQTLSQQLADKSAQSTYAFLDADYKQRAEPSDVITAVKAASGR